MTSSKYFVYVLKSCLFQKLYIGMTNDLKRRLCQHNRGEVRSTKRNIPYEVIYFEEFQLSEIAEKRERFFKTGDGRKVLMNKLASTGNLPTTKTSVGSPTK